MKKSLLFCLFIFCMASTGTAYARDCEITIGAVLPLTGPIAAIGQDISVAAELAVDQANKAGGVAGCSVDYQVRDTQSQPSVGVDAAKALVEISKASVILGAVSSGVSMPILTSVTVPAGVTQISCCSTASSFTKLARSGKTDGLWFLTLPTSQPQGVIMATIAHKKGFKNVAVIYVNSAYGVELAEYFKKAFEALGGNVTHSVAYNESQASYRTEVTTALQGNPDALFLVAFPGDGATIAREWISFGGSRNLLLSNALRSQEFVDSVGAKFLNKTIGIDNAQVAGKGVEAFNKAWEARFDEMPTGPGLHSMYDAAALALLAMEKINKPKPTGQAIAKAIRQITSGDGTVVYPGVKGFSKAKELLAAGKPIRYVGATGRISFDKYGNVTGPLMTWGVRDGHLTTLDTWDVPRIKKAMAAVNLD